MPSYAFVVRNGDVRAIVATGVGEINSAARADANRWIGIASRAGRNRSHHPRQTIVFRNSYAGFAVAAFVRQINRAVRRNFNVSVQTAALRYIVSRNCRCICNAAVKTGRHGRHRDILRRIINKVRITAGRLSSDDVRIRRTAADGLVVNRRCR